MASRRFSSTLKLNVNTHKNRITCVIWYHIRIQVLVSLMTEFSMVMLRSELLPYHRRFRYLYRKKTTVTRLLRLSRVILIRFRRVQHARQYHRNYTSAVYFVRRIQTTRNEYWLPYQSSHGCRSRVSGSHHDFNYEWIPFAFATYS